jgi:hypothetical protein
VSWFDIFGYGFDRKAETIFLGEKGGDDGRNEERVFAKEVLITQFLGGKYYV